MNKFLATIVVGLAAAWPSLPVCAGGQDVAKEQGCLKCHDVAKKKIGPAFQDVSARLKGKSADEGVSAMKAKSVHKTVAEQAGDKNLTEILEWVLTL